MERLLNPSKNCCLERFNNTPFVKQERKEIISVDAHTRGMVIDIHDIVNGLAFGDSLEGSACLLRRKAVSTSHLPGYIRLPGMC